MSVAAGSRKRVASALSAAEVQHFNALIEDLDLEVESRCDELRQQATSLVQSLRIAFRTQLGSLPARVRQMTLSEFVSSEHGGSVASVMSEQARAAHEALQRWVAATPLPSARKLGDPNSTVRRSARRVAASAVKEPVEQSSIFNTVPAPVANQAVIDYVAATPATLRGARGRQQAQQAAQQTAPVSQPAVAPPVQPEVEIPRSARATRTKAAPVVVAEVEATPSRYSLRRSARVSEAHTHAPAASSAVAYPVEAPAPAPAPVASKSKAAAVAAPVTAAREQFLAQAKAASEQMNEWMAMLEAPAPKQPRKGK